MTKAKRKNVQIAYKGFKIENEYTIAPIIDKKKAYCRGFEFELGKTYKVTGEIIACQNGFHACVRPSHVLSHYGYDSENTFGIVEQWGDLSHEHDKTASRYIKVIKFLTETEFEKLVEEDEKLGDVNLIENVVSVNNFDNNNYTITNKVKNAYVVDTDETWKHAETTVPAILIGSFETFKGVKGTIFVSTICGVTAKVDGKIIKSGVKYKLSDVTSKFIKAA